MIVAKTVREIRDAVAGARAVAPCKVGFVPTMGALHAGHYSLIDAARQECGYVVVSIFVNPTQFGPAEDLSKYPRPIEADLAGCRAHGAAAVFCPEAGEMYPGGQAEFATAVHVARLTERLCGAFRPVHFDGVCTVVAKLFNIVAPDLAYFGAKDYQQAAVVRKMTADLDMPITIRVMPTVREKDGLAMSSRNAYLSPAERQQALALVNSLHLAERLIQGGERRPVEVASAVGRYIGSEAPLGRVEYVEIVEPDILRPVVEVTCAAVIALAVRFPSARLIDNLRVELPARSR